MIRALLFIVVVILASLFSLELQRAVVASFANDAAVRMESTFDSRVGHTGGGMQRTNGQLLRRGSGLDVDHQRTRFAAETGSGATILRVESNDGRG
jgi:hypothetical protein